MNTQRGDTSILNKIEILEGAYQHKISISERPLLHALNESWKVTRPLEGKKVLVNAHLTLITLDLIRLLINAGAEVHVTASGDLAVHENTTIPLRQADIPLYLNAEIPEQLRQNFFDIVFDCGAGMLNLIKPTIGMVELTHTDPSLYQAIDFPVVTVDTSKTKKLETGLGTGNGLIRVLIRQAKIAIMTALAGFVSPSEEKLFETKELEKCCLTLLTMVNMYGWLNNNYLILGYGKVGKGIAFALKRAGVPQANIYIAEIKLQNVLEAQIDGYTGYNLANENQKNCLKSKLNDILCVITATGVSGAVSEHFEVNDFHRDTMFINMGTPDEYGEKFLPDQVLNEKKTANFMLEYPTEVKFLDPIFCILVNAGLFLANNPSLGHGLSAIPEEIDTQVLSNWMETSGTDLGQPRTRLDDELHKLRSLVSKTQNSKEDRVVFCDLINLFGAIARPQAQTPLVCFSPSPPLY